MHVTCSILVCSLYVHSALFFICMSTLKLKNTLPLVPDFSHEATWDRDRLAEYVQTITYEAESPDEAALVEVCTYSY